MVDFIIVLVEVGFVVVLDIDIDQGVLRDAAACQRFVPLRRESVPLRRCLTAFGDHTFQIPGEHGVRISTVPPIKVGIRKVRSSMDGDVKLSNRQRCRWRWRW